MQINNPINWQHKSIKISDMKEYEHNPRKIGKKELEKLANHIREDGYHQRIILNSDNTIIGGHQRKKALIAAGYSESDEIDVLIADRLLVDKELDRINIRDNLPFGQYDFDILSERFTTEDLVGFGMTGDMLTDLNIEEIDTKDDFLTEEELPNEPISKQGDLYVLGNHRLLCGDSTIASDVNKLLDGSNPIIMVTDPPYGVDYKPDWRNNTGADRTGKATGVVLNDSKNDWKDAYSLFGGDIAYVWHSDKYTHKVADGLEVCGFDLINLIIWNKNIFVLSRGDYHHKHEPLWYAIRKGKTHNWQGARDQSTVWDIDRHTSFSGDESERTGHSTQKPLECMLRPIINNTKEGESVYDPFGGSGTTLIACERSNRNCYMMELSPLYVDMIVARWENETGQKAVLVDG